MFTYQDKAVKERTTAIMATRQSTKAEIIAAGFMKGLAISTLFE